MKDYDWDSTYFEVDTSSEGDFEYVSEEKQYVLMQPAVDALCESLINDPHSWKFSTHTFTKKGTGVEYWASSTNHITDIWTGHTTEQVFSYNQGIQIRNAYEIARTKQASASQEKVMKSVLKGRDVEMPAVTQKVKQKKWWEIWK